MQKSTLQKMAADCNTSMLVPPLNIRNYLPDDWNTWITQFKVKALVTKFPLFSDQEKVAVLLANLGDGITPIFETFNVEVDAVSYEELIQLLSNYFRPAKTRHVFFSAKQKPQESFDHFAQRLTVLGYPCCFGPLQDGILCDVFLLNMDDKYDKIRNNILNSHRDLLFQEALILSKELLLKECNVTAGCRASDIYSSLESISEESSTFNEFSFKSEPSQATSSLQPDQHALTLNNLHRATHDDKEGSSLKLVSAIKNELGSRTSFSDDVPKLDFAFRCFPANGAPFADNIPNTHTSPHIAGDSKHTNSCSSEPPCSNFNHANFKSVSVSTRLSKFRNKGELVAKSPTESKIVVCELGSGGDSSAPTHYEREQQVSQAQSKHYINTWTSKPENSVVQANFSIKKDVSFGKRSGTKTMPQPQLMNSRQCLSDKVDDLPQKNFIETPTQNVEHDPNPEPPISKTRFSDVIIVFISEDDDTIHVCPAVKRWFLVTIEDRLKTLYDQNDLQSINTIIVGQKYAAPFKGAWFRAEIVSANMKKRSVRVSFCDYGNEAEIPLSDLRLLPEEFQDLEPLSFPIRLPKGAPAVEPGGRLKIRPLSFEDGWSWAVELRTSHQ
uniref:Putative ATP-dependent RNA helicase spindle-E n=3 Tax=Lygus hesperus TaxID=30085 RepID=A0A0A9YMR8_LYGHE